MQCYTFITDTDGGSGKVASQKARTVIRAHVMRKHWSEKPTSRNQKPNKPGLNRQEAIGTRNSPSLPKQSEDTEDAASSHCGHATSTQILARSTNSQDIISPRNLNRVTDEFVYAGSSIDLPSYRHFHHYSSEFSIMLPNSIQPLPLKKINTSCFMAVHENSPILLGTVFFMAAFHECMKRTKDSCGRLVATFSNQTVLRYKALTLQKLSDHLTKNSEGACVTETDILCVVILLFCETIAGDRLAVNAHLLGLTRIIKLYGGQQSLSPIVATHVQLTTLLAAQLDQIPPIFKLNPAMQGRYEKVSTTPFVPEDNLCQGFGTGSAFFSRPLCYELSSTLQQCLRYMRQVIARVEKYHNSVRVLEGEWIDDVLALEHTLVALPHKAALSKLEDCVRLAGLIYCNTALWRIPLYFRWVMSLVAHLKSALVSLNRREYPELHFWILFLGRQACTLEFPTAETAWWNEAVSEVAGELGIRSWDEACQTFQGFFYVERTHATRWRTVWADIEQGTCSLEPICDPEHPCDYM